jgi:3-phosphoshikimate 1-carboxyvinyltransferase
MTAICSLVPGKCRLTAGSSLAKRPVQPLIDALKQLGVKCSCQDGKAPVIIEGGLRGGTTEISGDISSQFVSALLLISPLADKAVTIRLTTPLESKPFVLMTLECMREFGIEVNHSPDFREFNTAPQKYQPAKYTVEGDWSSASYLLSLGAIGGRTITENLNPQSQQGDKKILELLREMGALTEIENNVITVKKSSLKAVRTDLTDYIDMLPTVAALTAVAKGTSELVGIKRARIKESNRVATVREGLERMGIKVVEEDDKLTVTGSDIKSAVIDSHDDHRIAMAFSILGSLVGETTIDNAECVSKTFPDYWDVFQNIGGKVKLNGK